MTRRVIDLAGQTFGRLTVIERAGTYSNGSALWLCHCTCGGSRTVASQALMLSRTRSCGCLRRQTFVNNLAASRARANGRKRMPGAPLDADPSLDPLLAAARAYWARQGDA